eukprot:m.220678 g.220678  ORF g.220678 m.220678 type:complete len:184 (-) comp10434_c0_seq1:404-955(-)
MDELSAFDPTALSSMLSDDRHVLHLSGIVSGFALSAIPGEEGTALSLDDIARKVVVEAKILRNVVLIDLSHSYLSNEDLLGISTVVQAVSKIASCKPFVNLCDNNFSSDGLTSDCQRHLRAIIQHVHAVDFSLSDKAFVRVIEEMFFGSAAVVTDATVFDNLVDIACENSDKASSSMSPLFEH